MKTTKIVNQFLLDYPNAIVLEFSKNMVLGKCTKTNKAYYYYTIGKDFGFCCNLLSEVSERFKWLFENTIESLNLKVETFENENNYFEIILEKN